jgi:hypothetical protein
VGPHFVFLMRANTHIRTWCGCAEQHETDCRILRKVRIRAAFIDFAFPYRSSRTSGMSGDLIKGIARVAGQTVLSFE